MYPMLVAVTVSQGTAASIWHRVVLGKGAWGMDGGGKNHVPLGSLEEKSSWALRSRES